MVQRSIVSIGTLLAGVVAAVVGTATPAPAAAINLMGYAGPIGIKFQNFEDFLGPNGVPLSPGATLAAGDQNVGVFTVSSIVAESNDAALGIRAGQNIWSPGGSNGYLAGIFNGITVKSITPSTNGFITQNTGGTFHLYNVSSFPDFAAGTSGYAAAGCGIGGQCYNGISNTGSGPVLTFNLIPGADITDPTSTLQATVSGNTIPLSGSALGWADITGGSDQGQFGRDGFTTAIGTHADLSLIDDFCANQAGCSGATAAIGNWQQLSNDPVGAATATVPEPSSLILFGGALLVFGLAGRRRWS